MSIEQEKDCVRDCILKAVKHFDKGNYLDALVYLEYALPSLHELHKIKEEEKDDGKVFLVGHIFDGWNDAY